MIPDISNLTGLVFVVRNTDEAYGPLRQMDAELIPADSGLEGATPFAEDECGNLFVIMADGRVSFWDHETNDLIVLATNWRTFESACQLPLPIELDDSQVKEAWIDPDFAKKFGVDAPRDGWIKRP